MIGASHRPLHFPGLRRRDRYLSKGLKPVECGVAGWAGASGRGREERRSLLGRLCLGGPYGVKEGLEVVPGYGCLLCQAEELTFLVNHSLLSRSVLSPSHLWALWCGGGGCAQELRCNLVRLRCLWGICGVGGGRRTWQTAGYTGVGEGVGRNPELPCLRKPNGERLFKEKQLGQALWRSVG